MTYETFADWAKAWMDLAKVPVRSAGDHVAEVVELWVAPIPGAWHRPQVDARIAARDRRCTRSYKRGSKPDSEHELELQLLGPEPTIETTICLGARLMDGVNAVPLVRDSTGGRASNVEADALLLVEGPRLLLVEAKTTSDNAWFAAVENLRQLKLFLESPTAQKIMPTRVPDAQATAAVTAVVLAPAAFYKAPGAKAAAVAPAQELLKSMRQHHTVDALLATWDADNRRIVEREAAS